MNKTIKIIIGIVAACCLAGAGIFYYFTSRFQYNPETAVGNTTGNLNNGGLFCEYDGKIYFSNPYDGGCLYVMDSDCTNARKLNDDHANSINVSGSHILYVKNNLSRTSINANYRGQLFGIICTDLNGGSSQTLTQTKSLIASLCGNYLYYQHYDDETALTFYKIKIHGRKDVKIADTAYNPASVYNGKIYFTDAAKKNNICSLDTATDRISVVYDANAYLVDAAGNYIYYIDVAKGYSLVRLNTSNQTLELLYQPSNGKIVNFNRYGNKIFFQMEGDNAGLYRMNADGTQIEYLASGNLAHIHCTSQYTFFQYFEDDVTLYRVPTTGAISKIEEITIK